MLRVVGLGVGERIAVLVDGHDAPGNRRIFIRGHRVIACGGRPVFLVEVTGIETIFRRHPLGGVLIGLPANGFDDAGEFDEAVPFVAGTGFTGGGGFFFEQRIEVAALGDDRGNRSERLAIMGKRAVAGIGLFKRCHFGIERHALPGANGDAAPIVHGQHDLRAVAGNYRFPFMENVADLEWAQLTGCIAGEGFTVDRQYFCNNSSHFCSPDTVGEASV